MKKEEKKRKRKKKRGGADTLVNTLASADIASSRGDRGPRASRVRRSNLTPPQAFKLLKETSFCSEQTLSVSVALLIAAAAALIIAII